jgi:hypothetical protein
MVAVALYERQTTPHVLLAEHHAPTCMRKQAQLGYVDAISLRAMLLQSLLDAILAGTCTTLLVCWHNTRQHLLCLCWTVGTRTSQQSGHEACHGTDHMICAGRLAHAHCVHGRPASKTHPDGSPGIHWVIPGQPQGLRRRMNDTLTSTRECFTGMRCPLTSHCCRLRSCVQRDVAWEFLLCSGVVIQHVYHHGY